MKRIIPILVLLAGRRRLFLVEPNACRGPGQHPIERQYRIQEGGHCVQNGG